MKELEKLLGRAIYMGLRCRLKGKLTVHIEDNKCFVKIVFDNYEYYTEYCELDSAILSGKFTSKYVIEDFCDHWEKYYMGIQKRRLFYPVLPEEKG